MAEEYKEDFEKDSSIHQTDENQNQNADIQAKEAPPNSSNVNSSQPQEKPHYLRFSIDCKSIKDLTFDANISVQYAFSLSTNAFKSYPPTTVNKGASTELKNTFNTFNFVATKSELSGILNSSSLAITFYHYERAENIVLLGTTHIQVSTVLNGTCSKTPNSCAFALDSYYPIDNGNKVGEVRVIIYLEDMGISQDVKPAAPNKIENGNKGTASSSEELDAKYVWELENWKHSEEVKFKANLKLLEIQTLNKIAEEYGPKEAEREKKLLDALQNVAIIESKIKKSANELQTREQKILRIEDELKSKINEVGKQLVEKEEEIVKLKQSFKEDRLKLEKDKKELQIQLERSHNQVVELKQTLETQQKEYQSSPINLLRQEISSKGVEIMELQRQLDKSAQVKEQYKLQYEKMKIEIIKMKKMLDEEKENALRKKLDDYERINMQITTQKMASEEQNEIAQLKEQVTLLQEKLTLANTDRQLNSSIDTNKMQINPINIISPKTNETQRAEQLKPSDLQALIKEKEELLSTGLYNQSDPLIQELTKQIEICQK